MDGPGQLVARTPAANRAAGGGDGNGGGRDQLQSAEAVAIVRYLAALGVAAGAETDLLVGKVLRRVAGRRLEPGESRAAAAVLEAQALLDQWLADCLGPAARSKRALGAARVALMRCLREQAFRGFVPGLGEPPPTLLQAIVTSARIGVPPLAHMAMQSKPLSRVPKVAGSGVSGNGDELVRRRSGMTGGARP